MPIQHARPICTTVEVLQFTGFFIQEEKDWVSKLFYKIDFPTEPSTRLWYQKEFGMAHLVRHIDKGDFIVKHPNSVEVMSAVQFHKQFFIPGEVWASK